MAPEWYVLRTKPHQEALVWQQLLARGFEGFYPFFKIEPVNPRSRRTRPYFPGYLFVRVDLDKVGLSTFQWMPHAVGLVCFGGFPASVPEEIVAGIRHRLSEVEQAGGELFYRLKAGDRVTILDGPFAGYEAIFDTRLSGGDRVRVLLQLLNERCLPVQVRAAQIERRGG
jgi:transcriptional antiterminator RfaH